MKNIVKLIVLMLVLLGVYSLIESFANIEGSAFKNPFVIIFLLLIFLLLIVIDSLNSVIYYLKNEKVNDNKEVDKNKNLLHKLWDFLFVGNPISIKDQEKITLTHNYDGIKELDNKLPRWWINMFYVTIAFAFIYIGIYHIFKISPLQEEELKIEIANAKEIRKNNNENSITIENVTLLTSEDDLKRGREIYVESCVVCHLDDGGGSIGPNFTDKYWILGGGIKNIFKTISEGGRAGKGMQAWKTNYSPEDIQKVSSYVISLQGTTPANPKEKEGDIVWEK